MAGEPVLLISRLARHTRNLERDPRAALLVVAPGGQSADPLAGARLTITGRAVAPRCADDLARRFLARHPEAAGYARFGDFGFQRIEPESGHLVAGFGRIVDLAASDLLLDLEGCASLAASEAEALDHVNADHADAVRLYATELCAAPDGVWRMTGLDPEGADLAAEAGHVARLDFPERVSGPGDLRRTLRMLAEQGRGSAAAS
jgi:putative heme iron utilization protein